MNPLNIFASIVASGLILLVGSYTSQQDKETIPRPATVRLVAVDITAKTNGKKAGDYALFSEKILSPEGRLIGNSYVSCIYVRDGIQYCGVVFNLPKGKITASGSRKTRKNYVFVVTGGTGVYSGTGGKLNGFAFGTNPFRQKITIELV